MVEKTVKIFFVLSKYHYQANKENKIKKDCESIVEIFRNKENYENYYYKRKNKVVVRN